MHKRAHFLQIMYSNFKQMEAEEAERRVRQSVRVLIFYKYILKFQAKFWIKKLYGNPF